MKSVGAPGKSNMAPGKSNMALGKSIGAAVNSGLICRGSLEYCFYQLLDVGDFYDLDVVVSQLVLFLSQLVLF